MRFSGKTDIDAPADFAFAVTTDHAGWEREAVRLGAEIKRPTNTPMTGVGASWHVTAKIRGKMRSVLVRITDIGPDQEISYAIEGSSMDGTAILEVFRLSQSRSRLRVNIEVKPKTLAARLLINTLRLAKGRVQAKFDKRLNQLAGRIHSSYIQSQPAAPQ